MIKKSLRGIALLLALITVTACKKTETEAPKKIKQQAALIEFNDQNNLADCQSTFLKSQANSPIHWQPWSKDIFTVATQQKKTVLAIIGSGTSPYFINALKQLNESPETSSQLNKNHINLLVDSDQFPDIEFFVARLCSQSQSPSTSPFLVWFSYEGVPLSWISIDQTPNKNISQFISRTSQTVSNMWLKSPEYVLRHSREDFSRRITNSLPRPNGEPQERLAIKSIRQAASLFDPTTNTIDQSKGLTVARYTKLLTAASDHANITTKQRRHYLKIAQLSADKIILQGLIDPLDNGVFSGRQQSTTALPIFTKNLSSQAYTADALFALYQKTGISRYRVAADKILNFTEKTLQLPTGGYAIGINQAQLGSDKNPYIWTLEELESALTPKELQLCQLAFGVTQQGNIPLEDDRTRNYYQKNTLSWKLSLAELSDATGESEEALNQSLKDLIQKLRSLHAEQFKNAAKEDLSTVKTSALLVQAQITAYRATGEAKYLKLATQGAEQIKQQFTDSSGMLHHASYQGKQLDRAALGADYTQLTKAAIALHEVTLDPKWLAWATTLQQQAAQQLKNSRNHQMAESDGSDLPTLFNIQQFSTILPIDNTSTWALEYSNLKYLESIHATPSLKKQSQALLPLLSSTLKVNPLLSVDFLTEISKINTPTIYLKMPVSEEMLKTAIKTSSRIIPIPEKSTPGNFPALKEKLSTLPRGSATIVLNNQILGTSSQATDIQKIILSSALDFD